MGAARFGHRSTGAALMRGKRPEETRWPWLVLAVLAAGVTGLLLGFGWSIDRQLDLGLMDQREQVAASPAWVPLEEMPDYLPEAFLSAVDPAFRIRRWSATETTRSISRDLVSQVYLLGEDPHSYARGAVLAGRLEHKLQKDSLLELYLNRIRLGRSGEVPVTGVGQAAEAYFGKAPADLTLSEAATLAGLVLAPRMERPERSAGPAGARRNEILRRLLLEGMIDDQAFRQATGERLGFQPGLAHPPMTRPPGWDREDEVIRLPAPLPQDPEA